MLMAVVAFLLTTTALLVFTDTNEDFQLPADVTSLYMGDSRMELGINDALLEHSQNCGAQSESFYYSYFKLKKLLQNNSGIHRVYLSVGHHSFSSYYDRFVDGNFSASVAPNYIGILPSHEQSRILAANSENALKFSRNFFLQGFKKLFRNDGNLGTGGFNNLFQDSKSSTSAMDKRFRFQYYTNQKLNATSEETLTYLKLISQLCAEKGVELIAISLPVHPYYFEHIPGEYREAFCKNLEDMQLKFFDLSQLPLSDDCYAPDGDHLSAKGADIATLRLKEII
ncbi:MAG: hypothetical protein ACK478_00245 [Flavobacteriales bacterium]